MRAVIFLPALVVVAALVGCGGKETVPVSGTVTYNNDPVADAQVMFMPVGDGDYATATTDSQGSFDSVSGRDGGQGLAPGDYKVTVSVAQSRAETEEISYEPDPPPPFPAKYTDPSTSDLEVTIESGAPQSLELNMQD